MSAGPPLNQPHTRLLSTSQRRCSNTQAELATTRHEALTLEHKIENLLEPVSKVGERPSDLTRTVEITEFWKDVLSDAFENLSTAAERPARVVVLGVDDWSGAEDLVTALLEEPLSSDQTQEDSLRDRWAKSGSSSSLTISAKPSGSSSSIHLSSSYLEQFSIPLEITELRSSASLLTSPNATLPTALFKADVPIIVFNPLTTPLSTLERLDFPSHVIFVASENPHLNTSLLQRRIQEQLLPSPNSEGVSPEGQRLLFVDPSRALSAVQAFRSNPTSALAIQQYQDNFSGSGISLVTKAIRDVVDSGANTSSPTAHLRNRTAIIQLHDALNAFCANVQVVQRSLDDILEGASQLTGRVEEAKVRVPSEVLGYGINPVIQEAKQTGTDVVGESLRLASKEMRAVLDRLSWWKTMWRIDEVSGIVGGAVDRVWCKDLEKKLILQTGCLLSLQQELTKSATIFVNHQTPTLTPLPRASHVHPLFTAHILKNTLSQLSSSPSYTLMPNSLTHPITKRKSQLLTYPTARLHLKAQRLVFGMSAGVASGSGFTWAGWMGYLMQSAGESAGSAIWNAVGMGMDPTTGIGVGLLGAAASVRWAVGKWEKEKRKWWADWERIGQGLERDLKVRTGYALPLESPLIL
ncbi:hypothetical protein P691DRAFT_783294 [Macrolepiota fuliginosa MF-IS2]|uniref:Uncharacterized protein n=1 Tax=Macrolepiota fuliginosa MF-IS2 TaxID=1400762 RepID=A0A9P6C938_9AGAR|nr:hypothetical protein P691DRAFT_783294 [Macrolepiota fuliginosa MF-IS2]